MTNNNNQRYPSWEHDPEIHGFWVIRGRLLATEYPGAKDEEKALRKLRVLRDAGITSFVDLTEAGERTWDGAPMVPYNGLLGPDVAYKRFAIPDTSIITEAGYDRILDYIRAELDDGRVVPVQKRELVASLLFSPADFFDPRCFFFDFGILNPTRVAGWVEACWPS